MSILVTVDEDADGPVVIKRATTPADAERLVAETHLLGIAAHPGVVAVVASDDGRLVLAHAGDRTLAHHVPRDLDEVIALVGGLAGTLDDLHRSGIAHMRVTPEHVVIAPHGRPVLCGLSAAVIDPDDAACGVDVEAVARLGLLLLDRCRRAQATVTDRLTWSISARRRRLQALLTDAGDPTRTPQSRMGPLSEAIAGFGLPEPPLPPAPPRPRPDDASPWPLRQVSAPPHDAPPRRGDPRRIAIAVAATLAMVGLAATLTWPRDARTAPSLVALPTPPTATEVPVAAEVPTSGDEQVADEP
ncbi:MAG: hypothetical protein KDB21_08200, partial [Acidimicrobiales bacterium]|nr:hypothetical protein [Acidimicrobiales bacterium]